jgi:hypothetical protein
MAVDLKDVLKEVQKKAYAADSSQDTLDLFYLLKSAVRADQNPYKEVNATLDLIAIPVLDRSPTMYYSKEDKKLYFSKDNEWIKNYIFLKIMNGLLKKSLTGLEPMGCLLMVGV